MMLSTSIVWDGGLNRVAEGSLILRAVHTLP